MLFSRNLLGVGIRLSTGRNACRGKVIYIWISPYNTRAAPTLGCGVVVSLQEN